MIRDHIVCQHIPFQPRSLNFRSKQYIHLTEYLIICGTLIYVIWIHETSPSYQNNTHINECLISYVFWFSIWLETLFGFELRSLFVYFPSYSTVDFSHFGFLYQYFIFFKRLLNYISELQHLYLSLLTKTFKIEFSSSLILWNR